MPIENKSNTQIVLVYLLMQSAKVFKIRLMPEKFSMNNHNENNSKVIPATTVHTRKVN